MKNLFPKLLLLFILYVLISPILLNGLPASPLFHYLLQNRVRGGIVLTDGMPINITPGRTMPLGNMLSHVEYVPLQSAGSHYKIEHIRGETF